MTYTVTPPAGCAGDFKVVHGTQEYFGTTIVVTVNSNMQLLGVCNCGAQCVYSYTAGTINGGGSGCVITSFSAEYSETSDYLDVSGSGNAGTKGFTLAINDGPNPKADVPGAMALFYIDCKDFNNPIVSVYAYNGRNDATSFSTASTSP